MTMIRLQLGTITGDTLTLTFDANPDLMSADELFAIADAADLGDDEPIGAAMDALADVLDKGTMTRRGLRTALAVAWVAHRRAGGTETLAQFLGLVAPATLKQLGDAPATTGDGGPRRPSATRQRPKARAAKK